MWRFTRRKFSSSGGSKGGNRSLLIPGSLALAVGGGLMYLKYSRRQMQKDEIRPHIKLLSEMRNPSKSPVKDFPKESSKELPKEPEEPPKQPEVLKSESERTEQTSHQEPKDQVYNNIEDFIMANVQGVSSPLFKPYIKSNLEALKKVPSIQEPQEIKKLKEQVEEKSKPEPKQEPKPEPKPELKPKPQTTPATETEQILKELNLKEDQIEALESQLQATREEIQRQRLEYEKEISEKMEETFNKFMEEMVPKFSQEVPSPASVLSSPIDFKSASPEEVQNKFEQLIQAYENSIQSSGVKNYEAFMEKLHEQRQKWKQRIQDLIEQHNLELEQSLKLHDTEWRNIVDSELEAAEQHFSEQAKLDEEFTKQSTTLDMARLHEADIQNITEELQTATQDRISQLEELFEKLRNMEKLQSTHYNIIVELRKIHNLHLTIENIQSTLNQEEGGLTKDLAGLKSFAEEDEMVAAALNNIKELYPLMIEKGIPTLDNLKEAFQQSSKRIKRAALLKSGTFSSYMFANIAYMLVPENVMLADQGNAFSELHSAYVSLQKGDLKTTEKHLEALEGFPREEAQKLLEEVRLRIAIINLVEFLRTHSVSVVKDLVVT